jgi:hypothetical protein
MNQRKWSHVTAAAALMIVGAIIGANVATNNIAHAEVRPAPEQPSFRSGDQISVPILREIAATLRQIDSRVARLETAAQKLQRPTTIRNVPVEDDGATTN